jgi:hypothetical protein
MGGELVDAETALFVFELRFLPCYFFPLFNTKSLNRKRTTPHGSAPHLDSWTWLKSLEWRLAWVTSLEALRTPCAKRSRA